LSIGRKTDKGKKEDEVVFFEHKYFLRQMYFNRFYDSITLM
jgi:hypothetical protein